MKLSSERCDLNDVIKSKITVPAGCPSTPDHDEIMQGIIDFNAAYNGGVSDKPDLEPAD